MAEIKPGYDEITTWKQERQSLFGALHEQIGIDETFLASSAVWADKRLEQYLHGLPRGFRAKIPPIGRRGVTTARNQVMVGETPKVSVLLPPKPRQNPRDAIKQRETLERKLQALLWQIDTTSSVETPLITFMDHCLGLGRGILSYPVAWDRWKDDPFQQRDGSRRAPKNAKERLEDRRWQENRARQLPWRVSAIHPRKCLWDPHHDVPEDVILEEKVSVRAILRRYPHLWTPDLEGGQHREGTLLTFVCPDYYGLWLDGVPLLTKKDGANGDGIAPNSSGIMWFRFADSGYGQSTFEGEWELRVQGLIRPIRDVLATYIVAWNQIETMRGVYAFPPMDITGPTKEEAEEAKGDLEYGPGSAFPHGPGIVAQPMPLPTVPNDAWRTMEISQQMLAEWFGDPVLSGQYQADPTSEQHARRLNQAKAPLKPAAQGGQQAVAAMLMDLCYQIKHDLDGPVTVMNAQNGIETLDASDIVDGMRILVDFTPPTKDELEQDHAEMRQRLEMGLVSTHRVMEVDPQIDDVDLEMDTIEAEKLRQSEPVLAVKAEAYAFLLRQKLEAKGLLPPPEPVAPEAAPVEPGMEGMPAEGEQMPMPMDMGQMAPMGPPPMPAMNGAGGYGMVPMEPG